MSVVPGRIRLSWTRDGKPDRLNEWQALGGESISPNLFTNISNLFLRFFVRDG
jgi:hypothetical protein